MCYERHNLDIVKVKPVAICVRPLCTVAPPVAWPQEGLEAKCGCPMRVRGGPGESPIWLVHIRPRRTLGNTCSVARRMQRIVRQAQIIGPASVDVAPTWSFGARFGKLFAKSSGRFFKLSRLRGPRRGVSLTMGIESRWRAVGYMNRARARGRCARADRRGHMRRARARRARARARTGQSRRDRRC